MIFKSRTIRILLIFLDIVVNLFINRKDSNQFIDERIFNTHLMINCFIFGKIFLLSHYFQVQLLQIDYLSSMMNKTTWLTNSAKEILKYLSVVE